MSEDSSTERSTQSMGYLLTTYTAFLNILQIVVNIHTALTKYRDSQSNIVHYLVTSRWWLAVSNSAKAYDI